MTAMTGKCAEDAKEKLAEIIIEAVKQIKENSRIENINLENIKILKVKGESIKNSELIFGVVLEKEKISHEMPSEIKGARIALIDVPLELKNPEINTKISISSPEQLQEFLFQEEQAIKQMVKYFEVNVTPKNMNKNEDYYKKTLKF